MSAIDQFREDFRKNKISSYYSGYLHFAFTFGLGLAVITYCLWNLSKPSSLELLTIPVTFLYANFIEYVLHRWPMHRKVPLMYIFFQRHTLDHHHFYTDDAMAFETHRDVRMVLFPPEMIFFLIAAFAVPIGYIVSLFLGLNVAYLFVAMGIGYILNYEFFHFLYHAPKDSWLSKIPFLESMRKGHTLHHDHGLMGKFNFNITYPIFDYIFGTWKN
jgi:hypothetical protein